MRVNPSYQPGYLALFPSGELARRGEELVSRLGACNICPRECGVNRHNHELGFCRSGSQALVAAVCTHHGEEPAISGNRGSGTVFFGSCNLHCVYCQNYQISQDRSGWHLREVDAATLADYLIHLQDDLGCHNINLVSPSHMIPQLVQALPAAVSRGLRLPLVYNSSSYDSVTTLKALDGVIDIFLADLRYASDAYAHRFSQAPDYVAVSRAAIQEMYRQVGNLTLDDDGVARRGLIVRHLILPHGVAGSRESLAWLAHEVSSAVTVSIMTQYHPSHCAPWIPLLARPILTTEYEAVINILEELELENGWIQEMGADQNYLPDFRRQGPPFAFSTI